MKNSKAKVKATSKWLMNNRKFISVMMTKDAKRELTNECLEHGYFGEIAEVNYSAYIKDAVKLLNDCLTGKKIIDNM